MTDVQRALAATLVDALRAAGTDTMFGMPGGGANLELIGAAEDAGMRFVLTHGETSSCIMASTYATLTGQVGLATMTRGPGATSAVNGAAQATLDRSPLVLVTDTVPADEAYRVPHQRVDQQSMFRPVTKFSGTIGAMDAEGLARAAVTLASNPPAGAVHLDFDPTAASAAAPPIAVPPGSAEPEALDEAMRLLGDSRRPMVLVGTEAWPWTQQVRRFVDDVACPVMTTYQARGLVPDRSPHAAGVFTNGAIERPLIASADLIIAIGLDPVELIPAVWAYQAPLVSLMPWQVRDPYLEPAVEVIGPIDASLGVLGPAVDADGWGVDEAVEHRRRALESLRITGHDLGPADVVEAIDEVLTEDVTVTVDAGAHMLVAVPMLNVNRPRGLLISNGLATMGYAIPAAVAAALARPGEPVVALTGDGGLGMVVSELETIARLDLPVAMVVFNDAALSLIEIKQGPAHGGAGAVRYGDIDFAGVARAMGVPGTRVNDRAELDEALSQIGVGPQLIDVRVDPSAYRHVIRATRG